jgi:4-amino-4-deoxy-L-arabinose transferase-like glycosyltransferase
VNPAHRRQGSVGAAAFVTFLLSVALASGLLAWAGRGVGRPVSSPDSSYYVSMARGFVQGDGFPGYFTRWSSPPDSKPDQVTHFPPGYPLLLASMEMMGVNPRGHGLMVANSALLLLSLTALGLIIERLTKSWAWAGLGVLASLSGRLMSNLFLRVWSEPLFVALLLLGALLLVEYTQDARRIWLILSGICLGLMALTRYAGVALILPAVLYVVIRHRLGESRSSRWTWIFAGLTALPLVIWLIRNELVAHTLAGGHRLAWEPAAWPIYSSLSLSFGGRMGVAGFLLVVTALLAFGAWNSLNLSGLDVRNVGWVGVLRRAFQSPVALIALLVGAYFSFVAVLGSVVNFDVNERMLGPGYPLLVVLLVVCAQWLWSDSSATLVRFAVTITVFLGLSLLWLPARRSLPILLSVLATVAFVAGWFVLPKKNAPPRQMSIRALGQACALVLVLFLGAHLVGWAKRGERSLQSEGEFFARSPLLSWINDNIHGGVVYSNEWERVYYNLPDPDVTGVRDLPRQDTGESLDLFYQNIQQTGGYIIFSEYRHRQNLYPEEQITRPDFVMKVSDFPDGRVYQILTR